MVIKEAYDIDIKEAAIRTIKPARRHAGDLNPSLRGPKQNGLND